MMDKSLSFKAQSVDDTIGIVTTARFGSQEEATTYCEARSKADPYRTHRIVKRSKIVFVMEQQL